MDGALAPRPPVSERRPGAPRCMPSAGVGVPAHQDGEGHPQGRAPEGESAMECAE